MFVIHFEECEHRVYVSRLKFGAERGESHGAETTASFGKPNITGKS